jgi:hypothetical protein
MNQETAVAVQDAAQVVERRTDVQVGNFDMPMLVWLRRWSLSSRASLSTSAAVPPD